jgi:hypothetical protein
MGNRISSDVCIVKFSERMTCPKVSDPIMIIQKNMKFLCSRIPSDEAILVQRKADLLLEDLKMASEVDQQQQHYVLMAEMLRKAEVAEPYPTSYAHCLGLSDTHVVFLSTRVAVFADMYSSAIIVDDEEFHRLYELFKETANKCDIGGNAEDGFLEKNIIAMNVPADTVVNPKTLDESSAPIPYKWVNPKKLTPTYLGGVSYDGTVHLAEGADPEGEGARVLSVVAEALNDANNQEEKIEIVD